MSQKPDYYLVLLKERSRHNHEEIKRHEKFPAVESCSNVMGKLSTSKLSSISCEDSLHQRYLKQMDNFRSPEIYP